MTNKATMVVVDSDTGILKKIIWAGFFGGLTEVVWVTLYCLMAGQSLAFIGQQIAITIMPELSSSSLAAWYGLGIHFGLSWLLSMAFVLILWQPWLQRAQIGLQFLITSAVLIAIWAVNFGWLLPHFNPILVNIVPFAISFTSKIWFGLALLLTLQLRR